MNNSKMVNTTLANHFKISLNQDPKSKTEPSRAERPDGSGVRDGDFVMCPHSFTKLSISWNQPNLST